MISYMFKHYLKVYQYAINVTVEVSGEW